MDNLKISVADFFSAEATGPQGLAVLAGIVVLLVAYRLTVVWLNRPSRPPETPALPSPPPGPSPGKPPLPLRSDRAVR